MGKPLNCSFVLARSWGSLRSVSLTLAGALSFPPRIDDGAVLLQRCQRCHARISHRGDVENDRWGPESTADVVPHVGPPDPHLPDDVRAHKPSRPFGRPFFQELRVRGSPRRGLGDTEELFRTAPVSSECVLNPRSGPPKSHQELQAEGSLVKLGS